MLGSLSQSTSTCCGTWDEDTLWELRVLLELPCQRICLFGAESPVCWDKSLICSAGVAPCSDLRGINAVVVPLRPLYYNQPERII